MVTCGINATFKEHGAVQPQILFYISPQETHTLDDPRTLCALSSSLRTYLSYRYSAGWVVHFSSITPGSRRVLLPSSPRNRSGRALAMLRLGLRELLERR